ncbi:hypothetical protein [Chenggangzhangella methanolivorans]|uniref:Uncharacterized protein n=1 Tax=Chenggangzhangella methanolivorans TaxID=1437009 RepID=A0A9E6R7L1_9HYPH|nr:hypothetical protein [Chenggangzhangella methanolivorans]QZN98754.1 hypothetical protein K6K41_17495 [Chenggangzhangella methanolivorans]
MFRIVRNLFGVVAALALMAALGFAAFLLGNSNPTINVGWFYGAAGISYTMIILLVLHRD